MSIVTRGLGFGGCLVAAGMAISIGLIVVPTPVIVPTDRSWNVQEGQRHRKFVLTDIAVTVTIPAVQGRGLLADIEAKGSALVGLYIQDHTSKVNTFKPSGAAKATIIGIRSDTQLGQILASGQHDMEDETILALLLALLET